MHLRIVATSVSAVGLLVGLSGPVSAAPGGFDVSLYAAHSNDRINAPATDENEKTTSGLALGLKLEFTPLQMDGLWNNKADFQWRLYGAALLSRRTFQVDSTGNIPASDEVTPRLTDADAGEFYLGTKLMWFYGGAEPNKNGWAPQAYAFYLRGEVGGISSSDSIGDLIDASFVGLGFEYGRYPFTGSFIEYGQGQTDLFLPDRRKGRDKFRLGIEYTLREKDEIEEHATYPEASVFVHVRVDADGKNDAADGVRVVAGVRLNAVETLRSLTDLIGLTTEDGGNSATAAVPGGAGAPRSTLRASK